MKFCTHVPRTCVHESLVLNFPLFAYIRSWRREVQTVHKDQLINERYLKNLQFIKENGSDQTCSNTRGTQITVESVFISRFTNE